MPIILCAANLPARKASRRILQFLSSLENPRSANNDLRYSSPSSTSAAIFFSFNNSCTVFAKVVFPPPDKPQNWMIILVILQIAGELLKGIKFSCCTINQFEFQFYQ